MIKKEVAFLAIGQAGSNIVKQFEDKGYSSFYLNTSLEDLRSIDGAAHTYHLKGADGSNRDRNKAKDILAANIDDVISEIQNKLPEPIIFVAFSCGGGTGSGLAPFLIDILQSETDKTVCAIAVLPSENESVKSHINSYEACKELADIENMGCTFFIDNEKNKDKFLLNTIFTGLLDSFLTDDSVSTKGNLDAAEAKELICTAGAAIISKLERDKATTSSLIGTFSNNIFAPLETDRNIKYVGLINSTYGIDMDELSKELGTPLDIFQGHDAPVTIGILSGLTFPFSRLTSIRDKVKSNQDTISKNLQTSKSNPLSEDINFLETLAPKPTTEKKKSSSRDALMKLRRLQA